MAEFNIILIKLHAKNHFVTSLLLGASHHPSSVVIMFFL